VVGFTTGSREVPGKKENLGNDNDDDDDDNNNNNNNHHNNISYLSVPWILDTSSLKEMGPIF
jgi:hypothetical protein